MNKLLTLTALVTLALLTGNSTDRTVNVCRVNDGRTVCVALPVEALATFELDDEDDDLPELPELREA